MTGQTTPENLASRNTCIIWRQGNVHDFELRLSYRIVAGNSGVQYRSSDLGDHVVRGYQCDKEAMSVLGKVALGEAATLDVRRAGAEKTIQIKFD
ncbi:MAG TPA: family 16 glycoside hydrolase [Pirellulales bacterium]|nr:family 16 glycoside hydrolase [Pirellulales bacterium]